MLVITRKENESIIIDLGDEVMEITVTEIGKQVRLGISAPKGCKIWRKELYATMVENRQALSRSEPADIKGFLQSLKHQKPSE